MAGGSTAGLILVNSGSLDTGFAPHAMNAGTGVGMYLVDLDRDGSLDVVTTSLKDGAVYWHENRL